MIKKPRYQKPEAKILSALDRILAVAQTGVVTGTFSACLDTVAVQFGFDEWSFSCNAGDQITIQVDPDVSNIVLNVVDPGGPQFCVDSVGVGAPESLNFVATASGTCLIQLTNDNINAAEGYVLTVNSTGSVSDLQQVTNGCTSGGFPCA